MNQKIKARTRYLVLFLLSCRRNTNRVKNWGDDINFKVSDIKSDEFEANNKLKQIKECLNGMKIDTLNDFGQYPYTALENFSIKHNKINITGATTDKLLKYINKRINDRNGIHNDKKP